MSYISNGLNSLIPKCVCGSRKLVIDKNGQRTLVCATGVACSQLKKPTLPVQRSFTPLLPQQPKKILTKRSFSSLSSTFEPSVASIEGPLKRPANSTNDLNLWKNALASTVFIYTDGSCIGNRNVAHSASPAGWGIVAVRLTENALNTLNVSDLFDSSSTWANLASSVVAVQGNCEVLVKMHGPVILPDSEEKLREFSLGAKVGSNNTGELTAIAEALLWARDSFPKNSFFHQPGQKRIIVAYDSEYAAKSISGEYNGSKNKELIVEARKIYTSLQSVEPKFLVRFAHVKGHSSNFWNDLADKLAMTGTRGKITYAGRYSSLDSSSGEADQTSH